MSVVEDIKGRLDIVETASAYLSLQKSGRNFKAPCPFHSEKTPSFIVNPERQSWRCFGACATGGDVFSLVMRIEGMDFSGALRLLAEKTGVSLSERRDSDRHDALYRINQAATRFYRDVLESTQGQEAMGYLEQRGLDSETIASFELGLSPPGWDGLKTYLLGRGFAEAEAVEAGLVQQNDEGNSWDFFRARLMFPIHDRQGRIAGLGGRALDDSSPKYMNTASTPVFDKRGTLYGLNKAAEHIRDQGTGVVVEGYMDVIAAHQFGFNNAVASMGTALTEQQVSQLKSLAHRFVLALDPDTAGQEATLRSLESSWRVLEHRAADKVRRPTGMLYKREPVTLNVAALPSGLDPDKLIREDSSEWERLIAEAVPLMEFLIPAVASRFDLSTGRGKTQVVEVLAPLIESAEFLDQDRYLDMLAKALQVSKDAVKASVGRSRSARGRGRSRSSPTPEVTVSPLAVDSRDALEDYTLALLLSKPELKEQAQGFAPEFFHKSEAREVFTRWLNCSTIDDLRETLDGSLHDHVTYLTEREWVEADRQNSEAALEQCLRRLETRHQRELQEGLLLSEDVSEPPPRQAEGPVSEVNARLKELFSQRTR